MQPSPRVRIEQMFRSAPHRSFRFWDVHMQTGVNWPEAQKILEELAAEGIFEKRGNGWYRWKDQ